MRILASILIAILLIQNVKVYGEEFEISIATIPEKLVSNSNALLIIQYKDQMLPFTPDIEAVISSNRTVIDVNIDTLRNIGNILVVDLDVTNSGETSITVIPKSGKPISETFHVYESNDIPTKMLLKVLPSSFSYLGPSTGYLTIQLVNAEGVPVRAERDYMIEVSSSNNDVVSLDSITIKEGEYFAIKKFNVKGYGESIIKAKYNDLVAESTISVTGPDSIKLKLYIAPEIAPAMKGQIIYAFVQLQDSDGNPIYTNDDIQVDLNAFTDDITTAPIIIKKGESTGIAKLTINTDKSCAEVDIDLSSRSDFSPCIELYAIAGSLKSESAFLELREHTTDDYIQVINSIDNPKSRLVPMLFPSDMPIIADGKEKIIGVIQLMSREGDQFDLATSKPIVPTHSIEIDNNNEKLIDLRDIVVEKPYSTVLVKARIGYLAGDAEVELFGERLDSSIINIKLHGHENVEMVAEPLIDKIVKNTNFPYSIYFIDDEGVAAYALEDLNVLISMNNEIVRIEPEHIKRGSAITLFDAIALEEGRSSITFEAISTRDHMQAISSMMILDQKGHNIELNIQDRLVKNSKGLASIQLLDGSGFPVLAEKDLNAYIYASNKLLNIPKVVTIPAGKYYAIFPIESYNDTGVVELRVFVDGFEPISKSIEIIGDDIRLVMESDDIRLNERLTITLKALYNDKPLADAAVRWENSKGLPIEYDILTNNEGIAKAKYLITEEGEHIFKAKINYKGLERETKLVLNSKKIMDVSNKTVTVEQNTTSTKLDSKPQGFELPIDLKYLLIIPAIAGIGLSIIRKRSSK